MTQPIHPMLERVARQMYEKSPIASPIGGEQWPWDFLVLNNWSIVEVYRDLARAAIQALMEPDEGMVEAGIAADSEMSVAAYQAMLRPLVEGEGE